MERWPLARFQRQRSHGPRTTSTDGTPQISGCVMNDSEREQWVNNDEGLYSWWKSSRLPMRTFIRENRKTLTASISNVLGREPERTARAIRSVLGSMYR